MRTIVIATAATALLLGSALAQSSETLWITSQDEPAPWRMFAGRVPVAGDRLIRSVDGVGRVCYQVTRVYLSDTGNAPIYSTEVTADGPMDCFGADIEPASEQPIVGQSTLWVD